MRAYCYASGLIEFGKRIPDGAIQIAEGPTRPLRKFIEAKSRHGYNTQRVDGRQTKIPGTDCLLVPGIPEAPNQIVAGKALRAWCDWIAAHAPAGIAVT